MNGFPLVWPPGPFSYGRRVAIALGLSDRDINQTSDKGKGFNFGRLHVTWERRIVSFSSPTVARWRGNSFTTKEAALLTGASFKKLKHIEQNGLCAICKKELPLKYSEMDRTNASAGYTRENTRLLHRECHVADQAANGYR
jgi:hypothetical protein